MLAEKVMVAISRVDNIIDPSRQLPHEKPLKILADKPKEERLVLLTIPLHCFQYEAHCSAGRHDGHDGQDNKHAASKVSPPVITLPPLSLTIVVSGRRWWIIGRWRKRSSTRWGFLFPSRERFIGSKIQDLLPRKLLSTLHLLHLPLNTYLLKKYFENI